MKKYISILFLAVVSHVQILAQQIYYADVDREDYKDMNFEIIGKVGGNINVYKNFKNRHDISVYDLEMQQKSRINLGFLPERIINVDFVAYPDFSYMIYQYSRRGIVHCAYVKLNGEGKLIADPVEIDTSLTMGSGASKIYTVINSEDKKKIVVFKIRRQNEKRYQINAQLFDNTMTLLKRSSFVLPANDRDGGFTDFLVDNDGDFVFGRSARTGNREYVNKLDLVYKKASSDTVRVLPIALGEKSLDEIKIRLDNNNKKIILTSFFYKQKKGNIDGLYAMVLDKKSLLITAENELLFSDSLRFDAKSENGSLRAAFNDHFIRNVVPVQDGSFAVVSELYYSSSRGNTWNRYDYLYGNSMFYPYDMWYYSPMSRMYGWGFYDPFGRFGQPNNMVRHVAENIMVFYFTADGKLSWTNTIRKNQFDDNTDAFVSYQLFNTGNEVRFLFNQREKRELLLNSATIDAAGKLKRQPTLKNLNRDYDFMPKFGKQIGLRQIIMPCMYKNYICFAKLEF
jgi:hypothetical protein